MSTGMASSESPDVTTDIWVILQHILPRKFNIRQKKKKKKKKQKKRKKNCLHEMMKRPLIYTSFVRISRYLLTTWQAIDIHNIHSKYSTVLCIRSH